MVPGDPVGEAAMAYVLVGPLFHHVAGVDDDVPAGGGKELFHVCLEDVVLDEVIDDVEGHGKVGAGAGGEEISFEEAFGGVAGEEGAADLNGFGRDVDAGIAGILCQFELGAVSAAVFDDGGDVILLYESVKESGFEFGKPVIAAGA